MKKEIEAFVNAANEQELEAAWNNLSAEEQRIFEQLMEEDSPEDALAFFAQLYDDTPKEQASETVSISENEIYFKRQPLTEEQKKHGSYVDENGNLHVKNLSAFWIPELTTTEKVGHTTYTVTGSYEGKESFLKKLERIVAKNAQQKFEDEGALYCFYRFRISINSSPVIVSFSRRYPASSFNFAAWSLKIPIAFSYCAFTVAITSSSMAFAVSGEHAREVSPPRY